MHKRSQVISFSFTYYQYFFFFFESTGQPVSTEFDPYSARFQFVFTVNTDINQPTIIYINEELNYPHGADIIVTPANSLTWNSTSLNYYEFTTTSAATNGTSINILITAKRLAWYHRVWNWIKTKFCFL